MFLNEVLALPFAVAFIVAMLFGPGVIAMLKRRKVGQTIQADGPESHKPKAGTPTMGGLIIIAGVLAGVLAAILSLDKSQEAFPEVLSAQSFLAVVLLMVGYAVIGAVDDWLTIHPIHGVRGIASKPKAIAQFMLALAFIMWLKEYRSEEFVPVLYIAGKPIITGWFYWVFATVFIAGMANFVNITDGLDGLVSGLTVIAILGFIASCSLGVSSNQAQFVLLAAFAGACVGFLWFNANPAKVFMGDTGALAIGVTLPAVAILVHKEVLMIVVGMVFILDGLSTALQWAVFKYTRITTGTGRRVFKKSPIHHHFEMSGWAEQNVVVRFWIIGIIAAAIGFAGADWRIW